MSRRGGGGGGGEGRVGGRVVVGEDEEGEGGDGNSRDFDEGRSLQDLRRRRGQLHGLPTPSFGFSDLLLNLLGFQDQSVCVCVLSVRERKSFRFPLRGVHGVM